jgi:hypothetical protein
MEDVHTLIEKLTLGQKYQMINLLIILKLGEVK